MLDILRDLLDDAAEWAEDRWWLPRLPLLAYLAYVGWRHLREPEEYSSLLFGGVTFGVHELGHVIFSPLGELLGIAGGSLAQVLAPIAAGLVFLFWQRDGEPQRDYFGVAVAGCWLAFSLWNLATYVGDAKHQDLPLLGLSSDPIHDWAYLLGRFGLVDQGRQFAGLIRLAAFAAWTLSLLFGGWLLKKMARP